MKGVGENESGVLCELCEQWWHAGCAMIPEEVYKVLNKCGVARSAGSTHFPHPSPSTLPLPSPLPNHRPTAGNLNSP